MANPWEVVKTEPATDPWAVVSTAPMTANIPGAGEMPLPGSGGEAAQDDPYEGMSFMDRVMNDLKIMGRGAARGVAGVTEGVASVPGLIADFPVQAYNLATGGSVQTPTQALSGRLDQAIEAVAPQPAVATSDRGGVRTVGQMAGSLAVNPMAAFPAKVPANFRGDLTGRTGAQEVAEKGANMGLKVNPADPNLNPSRMTRILGALSNRPKVEDMLSRGNQAPMSAAVSRGGELQQGEPLTREMMAAGRDRLGSIYEAVKNTGPLVADEQMIAAQANPVVARIVKLKLGSLESASARESVDAWRQISADARKAWKAADSAPFSPSDSTKARDLDAAADALKAWIDRGLRSQGQVALADEFLTAPQRIAQSHTLSDAVVPGAKAVDVSVLARALNKDVPLQGESRTLAEFATVFPQVSRSPVSAAPNVAGAAAAAEGNIGAAAMSHAAGGSPAAAAASGGRALSVTGIPAIARALLLRESLQRQATGQAPMPNDLSQLLRESRFYTGFNAAQEK